MRKEEFMPEKHCILGIHVTNRARNVPSIQAILTEYGCNIRTRIGLHDADGRRCSTGGLILLEVVGDKRACDALGRKLAKVRGVEVRKMTFGG